MSTTDPTKAALAYLGSALDPSAPMREYLGELFARQCPQYFSLAARERPAFLLDTLPTMLRAFVALAFFPNDLKPEDVSFTEPLPQLEGSPEEADMVTFLLGVADSWAASLDAHRLYAALGADFQALVDPLAANYKYGLFLDAPTLEHADYLLAHPELIAYIRSNAPSHHYSNLVWDTYIDRFPKDAVRPQREPDTRLLKENLEAILTTAGFSGIASPEVF